jgi:hypothetical protein
MKATAFGSELTRKKMFNSTVHTATDSICQGEKGQKMCFGTAFKNPVDEAHRFW